VIQSYPSPIHRSSSFQSFDPYLFHVRITYTHSQLTYNAMQCSAMQLAYTAPLEGILRLVQLPRYTTNGNIKSGSYICAGSHHSNAQREKAEVGRKLSLVVRKVNKNYMIVFARSTKPQARTTRHAVKLPPSSNCPPQRKKYFFSFVFCVFRCVGCKVVNPGS